MYEPLPGLDPSYREPVRSAADHVERDGRAWPLGTAEDVDWITAGTVVDRTIASAVPPRFEAYVTIELPPEYEAGHDAALLGVLRDASPDDWWLGYLDTGADDVVFPDARRTTLYAGWPYVVVRAGPEQAATWRPWEPGSFWAGHLPNLMFPATRDWLCTTLWDDDWTCVGGSAGLVDALLADPRLGPRGRRVRTGEDMTPPGHTMI